MQQNSGNLVDAALLAAAAAVRDARIPQLDVFEVAGDSHDFEVEHEKPPQRLTVLVGSDVPVRACVRACVRALNGSLALEQASEPFSSVPTTVMLPLLLLLLLLCHRRRCCCACIQVCATVHRIGDREVFDLVLHEEACSSTCLAIAVRACARARAVSRATFAYETETAAAIIRGLDCTRSVTVTAPLRLRSCAQASFQLTYAFLPQRGWCLHCLSGWLAPSLFLCATDTHPFPTCGAGIHVRLPPPPPRATNTQDDARRPCVQHVDAVRERDAQGRAVEPAAVRSAPVPRSARRSG